MLTFDWEAWVASRDEANPPDVPSPVPADAPERVRLAHDTVLVLDLMVALFDGGEHWGRGAGHFSLTGALAYVRRGRTERDNAGVYLRYAIRENWGKSLSLVDFNDTRGRYAEVGMVIRTARMNAKLIVDKYLREQ
jgi:hypothetical protein